MPTVNHPDTVNEVTTLCEAYEQALVTNHVAALKAFFWNSPHAVRFGADGQLYGADAISAFRDARVVNFSQRQPLRLTVHAFGSDFAVALLEYSVQVGDEPRHGRQTQSWVRFPEAGWRITSAHVSLLPLDAAHSAALALARTIGLPLAPGHSAGALTQLTRTAAIVAPLLAFPLPEECEPAPVFSP